MTDRICKTEVTPDDCLSAWYTLICYGSRILRDVEHARTYLEYLLECHQTELDTHLSDMQNKAEMLLATLAPMEKTFKMVLREHYGDVDYNDEDSLN